MVTTMMKTGTDERGRATYEQKPVRRKSLFDLGEEWSALGAALDECETEEGAEALLDAVLPSLLEEITTKSDGYAALILDYEVRAKAKAAEAKALEEEARRIKERAKALEGKAERLKARLLAFMGDAGLDVLEGERWTVRRQQSGGAAPVVVECDPGLLPVECRRVRYEADKEAIRKALEAGREVKGCRLGERGHHLRIR